MKKNVLLLLIIMAVSFSACNKIQTDTVDDSSFVKISDLAALNDLIIDINVPVEWTKYNSNYKSTQAFGLVNNWTASSPHLANGSSDYLSASCVEESAGYIHVGFHDRGDEFYGQIITLDDSGDVEDNSPVAVVDAIYSERIDINDLEISRIDTDKLWVAGESNRRGAEALSLKISSGVISTMVDVMPIFGASANSITSVGEGELTQIWVSSGGKTQNNILGGLIALDLDGNKLDEQVMDNAKHFDADGTKGLWLYGNNTTESRFWIFDNLPTWDHIEYIVPNNALVTSLGKNAVDLEGDFAFIAMGKFGVYKIALIEITIDGTLYTKGSSVARYYVNTNVGFANGVKTDGKYVYIAHGADGLIICDMDLEFIGSWDGTTNGNESAGSCNYVDISDATSSGALGETRVLYAAFGRGGMHKLTLSF